MDRSKGRDFILYKRSNVMKAISRVIASMVMGDGCLSVILKIMRDFSKIT